MRSVSFSMLLFLFVFTSCNQNACNPGAICETVQPTTGLLSVEVTVNASHPAVEVAIYSGQFEEGNLIFLDTLEAPTQDYSVPLDEYYAVTAKYVEGADTIIALDGAKVKLSSSKNCNETCYTVLDGIVDLKLK